MMLHNLQLDRRRLGLFGRGGAGVALVGIRDFDRSIRDFLHRGGQCGDLARSCSLAAVTVIANRFPDVSTAEWTFDPLRFFAPSKPARPPLSGVDWTVRESTIIAVGCAVRPSSNRTIDRKSCAMVSNTPAWHQRRAC